MDTKKLISTIVISFFICTIFNCTKQKEAVIISDSNSIIIQIDQVYVSVESINDVRELKSLFSDTFQLPASWPPSSHGTFFGGGVFTGNTWFKFVTSRMDEEPILNNNKKTRFSSFMMEPAPKEATFEELDKRSILYTKNPPRTLLDSLGNNQIWVETATFNQLSSDGTTIKICYYTPTAFSMTTTPTASNIIEHRSILKKELTKRKGGPLGIEYLNEIVLGVTDYNKSLQDWQNLLDPIKPISEGFWEIGNGPTLRIVSSSEYGIKSIVFKIKSLEQARNFLELHDMLGHVSDNSIMLNKRIFYGLNINLIE